MTKKTQNKVLTVLSTDGSGYWTKRVGNVDILGFGIDHTTGMEDDYGEMRVYFEISPRKANGWVTRNHGLIYTDRLWLSMLRRYLQEQGFSKKAVEDVSYSEQGMQGSNYVSLDIGEDFLKELDPLVNFVKKKKITLPYKLTKSTVAW